LGEVLQLTHAILLSMFGVMDQDGSSGYFSDRDEGISSDTTFQTTEVFVTTILAAIVLFVGLGTATYSTPIEALATWLSWARRQRQKLDRQDSSIEHGGVKNDTNFTAGGTKTTITTTSTIVGRSPSNSPVMWWDNLAPPFSFPSTGTDAYDDNDSVVPEDIEAHVTHFCFLIHGHRGFSNDLSYLHSAMEHLAEREKRKRWTTMKSSLSSESSTSWDNESLESSSADDIVSPPPQSQSHPYHDIKIHSAVCNERKTMDGVEKGGQRLVDEILSVIREEMNKRQRDDDRENGDSKSSSSSSRTKNPIKDITLSIVGNSLGGIYGRYAIAKLEEVCSTKNGLLLDTRYRIHFNVFCTTATPHLGISKHTYVPLPRTAEIVTANFLGDTGKDLFRLNDLLRVMATSPQYLHSLASFKKRIAYANAYATDFPVPASTAAFLSDGSDYPHHYLEEEAAHNKNVNKNNFSGVDEVQQDETNDGGVFVAAFHTPRNIKTDTKAMEKMERKDDSPVDEIEAESSSFSSLPTSDLPSVASSNSDDDDQSVDELLQMSNALDSLGWKKVFVDVRNEIPISVNLPRNISLKRLSNSNVSDKSTSCSDEFNDNTMNSNNSNEVTGGQQNKKIPPPIRQLKQKRVVESRDVFSAVSLPDDNKLSFPLGHNMIVALSRSRISALINKGGRKVVDALAKELVEDIFSWHPPSTTDTR